MQEAYAIHVWLLIKINIFLCYFVVMHTWLEFENEKYYKTNLNFVHIAFIFPNYFYIKNMFACFKY